MKYNCDNCKKEFDLMVNGPCAIALAYCKECSEKTTEELKEILKKKENELQKKS